jgi:hypothetical protein
MTEDSKEIGGVKINLNLNRLLVLKMVLIEETKGIQLNLLITRGQTGRTWNWKGMLLRP